MKRHRDDLSAAEVESYQGLQKALLPEQGDQPNEDEIANALFGVRDKAAATKALDRAGATLVIEDARAETMLDHNDIVGIVSSSDVLAITPD